MLGGLSVSCGQRGAMEKFQEVEAGLWRKMDQIGVRTG